MNEVLKNKDGNILNPNIPRYEKFKNKMEKSKNKASMFQISDPKKRRMRDIHGWLDDDKENQKQDLPVFHLSNHSIVHDIPVPSHYLFHHKNE